ncbi:hypothetical protein HK102_003699 [Quaeritorhiza haematococci]|nr:hypothetical protein HK102_003699 [Quaeritorhiza haematococci]
MNTPQLKTAVILIRHGEKLDWTPEGKPPHALDQSSVRASSYKQVKSSYVDNGLLSAKGWERSHALVPYFSFRTEMRGIFDRYPLAAIIAQDVDLEARKRRKHKEKKGKNQHSEEGEEMLTSQSGPEDRLEGEHVHQEKGKGKKPKGVSERPRQTVQPLVMALMAAHSAVAQRRQLETTFTSVTTSTFLSPHLPINTAFPPASNSLTSSSSGTSPGCVPPFLHLFTKRRFDDMISLIRDSPSFHGKSVIVSWSHQQLPEVANILLRGGNGTESHDNKKVPRHWPGERYDVTWVLLPEPIDSSEKTDNDSTGSQGPTFLQYAQRLLFGDLDTVIV